MSLYLMEIVAWTDLPMAQKMVLRELANYADDNGLTVPTAIETLMARCSMSRRGVQTVLAELRAKDEKFGEPMLIASDHATGGRGRAASHRINIALIWARTTEHAKRKAMRQFHVKRRIPRALSALVDKSDSPSMAYGEPEGDPRSTCAVSEKGAPDAAKGAPGALKGAPGAAKGARGAPTPLDTVSNLKESGAPPMGAHRTTPLRELTVSEEMKDWARRHWSGIDVGREAEQFVDHYRAKGESPYDIDAAWRKWVRGTRGAVRRPDSLASGTPAEALPRGWTPSVRAGIGATSVARWGAAQIDLRNSVGPPAWASWLRPLTLASEIDADPIVVDVPTKFVRDRVEQDYGAAIAAALGGRQVVFRVAEGKAP